MNGSLTGCLFDFDEERDQCELDFEAVKRVKLGEEHCWDTMEKGNQVSVEERKQEAGELGMEKHQAWKKNWRTCECTCRLLVCAGRIVTSLDVTVSSFVRCVERTFKQPED